MDCSHRNLDPQVEENVGSFFIEWPSVEICCFAWLVIYCFVSWFSADNLLNLHLKTPNRYRYLHRVTVKCLTDGRHLITPDSFLQPV